MSSRAIFETTKALETLLVNNIQILNPNNVYIGAPVKEEGTGKLVSIFLFHIEPNFELRNEQRFAAPPIGESVNAPVKAIDALPLDLRYMITVFREAAADPANAEPEELNLLGSVIQVLHTEPTLLVPELPNQIVRLTPEPYPMEETNRIWSLFPQEVYRTSMVYLASPVFIEADDLGISPPVLERIQKSGVLSEATSSPELQGNV